MMRRMTIVLALALGVVPLASGCGGEGLAESLEGEWSSVEPIDQSHNELVMEDGGEGTATIYIFRTVDNKPQASPFSFDVEWQESGEDVEVDMSCVESPFGECEEEDDVSMDCEVVTDPLGMECDAEGRWRDYDFRWKKI